jgi:hypothetical protein
MKTSRKLPQRLADIAEQSESLLDFGMLLREWNHQLTRNDVSNRKAIARAIQDRPQTLSTRFQEGEIADAYLAAYAEWIADQVSIERPAWSREPSRVLREPWFADNARASLLILSPASFRQRNLFTVPEVKPRLRKGRPQVSEAVKKAKARERDQRYRARIRKLVKFARSQ